MKHLKSLHLLNMILLEDSPHSNVPRHFQMGACLPSCLEEVQLCVCQRGIKEASVSLGMALCVLSTPFAPQPSSLLWQGPRLTGKPSAWGKAGLACDKQ